MIGNWDLQTQKRFCVVSTGYEHLTIPASRSSAARYKYTGASHGGVQIEAACPWRTFLLCPIQLVEHTMHALLCFLGSCCPLITC